jgi:hypothetical protein
MKQSEGQLGSNAARIHVYDCRLRHQYVNERGDPVTIDV